MKQKLIAIQFISALVLVVGISIIPAIAQWSEPPAGTVAPANNAPAPLNVGASTQSKAGNLIVNAGGTFASGLLVPRGDVTVGNTINDASIGASAKVKAFGNIWGDKYCDRDGNNCYTTQEMAGGGGGGAGGVSKIIAGAGIGVSPSAGTGEVTVSSLSGTGNFYIKSITAPADDFTVNCNAGDTAVSFAVPNYEDQYGWEYVNFGDPSILGNPNGIRFEQMESGHRYQIICYDKTADVPGTTPAPTLTLTASPNPANCQSLFIPQPTDTCRSYLSWTSAQASVCTASGDWSGSKNTSGNESISFQRSASPNTYTLNCTGPGGSASKTVTVTAIQ